MMQDSSSRIDPVVLIVGPTASGKTAVSVALAERCGAEVVSADSRQVYRYCDIGTAKPTEAERGGVPHHGFDIADPPDRVSAGRFAHEARGWIEEIRARGRRVVVAGGSGLYLQALVDGFFAGDVKDEAVRAELERRAAEEGLEALYAELKRLDPAYAAKTRPGDRQRILRALEVCHAAGEPFSALHGRGRAAATFPSAWFGLEWPRGRLYERIDRRVAEMFDRGLVAEVRGLLDRGWGEANALKSVGYTETIDFLGGRLPSLEAAMERIRRNTRRYAKRQLTWFRRDKRIRWLAAGGSTPGEIAGEIACAVGWE